MRGARALAQEARMPYPPFQDAKYYLVLRSGAEGPSEIRFLLDGRDRRFRGRASAVRRPPDSEGQPVLLLSLQVDGTVVQSSEVPYYPGGLDLDVDLSRGLEFGIVADRKEKDVVGAWIHIADPRIEVVK
jgi:hypothetical protein